MAHFSWKAASERSRPIRGFERSISGRVSMSDLLVLRQVSAGYGDAVVISDIDLSLRSGESLAVLGRNGTGKTTLLNTIIGATRQRGGTIMLDGVNVTAV